MVRAGNSTFERCRGSLVIPRRLSGTRSVVRSNVGGTVRLLFDRDFFRDPFLQRVADFAREHNVRSVKVDVVTRSLERYNIQAIHSSDEGARLITLEGMMVFLPYHEISRVEVSVPRGDTAVGFQLPSS